MVRRVLKRGKLVVVYCRKTDLEGNRSVEPEMEKKFKQALKKKTPLIKRDTSQNESILEEILSISGKKTKQLKESTVEVPSADDAEVEQINTDIEKITDVPAIKIKKEPLDAMSVENEEPIDASPVKIKKEPI
ncbi:uncharacterized protein NPIL_115211, partial [Nephila pilipes]